MSVRPSVCLYGRQYVCPSVLVPCPIPISHVIWRISTKFSSNILLTKRMSIRHASALSRSHSKKMYEPRVWMYLRVFRLKLKVVRAGQLFNLFVCTLHISQSINCVYVLWNLAALLRSMTQLKVKYLILRLVSSPYLPHHFNTAVFSFSGLRSRSHYSQFHVLH